MSLLCTTIDTNNFINLIKFSCVHPLIITFLNIYLVFPVLLHWYSINVSYYFASAFYFNFNYSFFSCNFFGLKSSASELKYSLYLLICIFFSKKVKLVMKNHHCIIGIDPTSEWKHWHDCNHKIGWQKSNSHICVSVIVGRIFFLRMIGANSMHTVKGAS